MSLVVNPYAYFTDTNGDALNGYLYIGEVGKNAENYPIAIYYDALLTTPAPNPLTVSAGYIYNGGTIAQIYAAVDYSLIAKTTGGSLVYSSLNETGMTNGAIANIDEMKDFVAPYDNYALNVLGYSEAGDGGGGLFYYDINSTEADNGGTIIEPTSGNGRWIRQYSGAVNVEWFGASPNATASANTAAITLAFNFIKNTSSELVFDSGTYLVTKLDLMQAGDNSVANFRIVGNNTVISGSSIDYTFRMYRIQGLIMDGISFSNTGGATHTSVLDSFWFANISNCNFGTTKLHADAGWGVYWNEFNGCHFSSIYFDLTHYTINQNIWKGGRVGAITKSDALHSTFKEAYNNVFIGVDILGAIDWRDPSSEFGSSPIILRDCNMEYSGTNYGRIFATGGRSNPVSPATLFPWDNMSSEFDMVQNGSIKSTGWKPYNSTNLLAGGACQSFNRVSIFPLSVSSEHLSIFSDSNSPSGNELVYRLYVTSQSSGSIVIVLPSEYLEEAKSVGSVSFSFWVYDVIGTDSLLRYGTGGSESYPTGYGSWSGGYKKCFVNVPVGSDATSCYIKIGGNNLPAKDIRVSNISINLGKIAVPYSPSTNESSVKKYTSITKTLIANGASQQVFSFPSNDGNNRIKIKASSSYASATGLYSGELGYVYYSGNNTTGAYISKTGSAGAGAGGGAGTITTLEIAASGSTITVSATIFNYSGNPSVSLTLELEALDVNMPTITIL